MVPDRKPNRLIHEQSPYLLQHAHNPVDWHPWGEEAFETARREDRPIFLSIGYSTCHWCHVMERESFEDEEVAAALNRDFVPVKVDREERPDVDRIYMTAMQAMGLGGGWPLNVFLTPALEPFFGGTYFAPRARMGRPGMLELLPQVREAWRGRRDELERAGEQILASLASLERVEPGRVERADLFERAFQGLARLCDRQEGGFGDSPKFPTTANLDFLWRLPSADPARRAEAGQIARLQLDAMRRGGIHDHLGGGFHRYATDRAWRIPHFEKMLYDQALIAWAYLDGFQNLGDPAYAATARGVFEYVERDLSAPEGGFYSAEDADSEGEEGRFYVWTAQEIESALGPEAGRAFCARYGVTAAGNFEHGASVLHEAGPAGPDDPFEAARRELLALRSRRVRPHRDDKVLVAWNGLTIAAFARGARVLGAPGLASRAEAAAEFVWSELRDDATGGLHRRWRRGEAGQAGQLADYAYYAHGLIELYRATFDPRWLERAVEVTSAQIARFWDERDGGFFESPEGDPSIKLRMKDGWDGAELAGNSIAALVLVTLGELLDRRDWQDKAERTLDYWARRIAGAPLAMPRMLVAMGHAESGRQVVIAGRPDAPDTRAMIAEFERRFLPRDLLLVTGGGARPGALARLAPWTEPLSPQRDRATAYVCVARACRLPITDASGFAAELDRAPLAAVEGR